MIPIIPKKIDTLLRFIRALKENARSYFYDFIRYATYSIKKTYPEDRNQLEAKIISLYHVIEKGLTMPETRIGFGKDRIELLITLLRKYNSNYQYKPSIHFDSSLKVLESYVQLHKDKDVNIGFITEFLRENQAYDSKINGGYYKLKLGDFEKKSKGNFLELCEIRNSIRNFSEKEVDLKTIKEAIKIAQTSPSTCNRQSSRVYIVKNQSKIKELLELQSGSRGFGHKINKLLLLGYEIKSYQGSGDRNSGYIDSSLFAMTLIYALTYMGIGTVCLNWSKPREDDLILRKISGIDPSHNIIFFIGLGKLCEETKIAVSARSNTDEIIHYL